MELYFVISIVDRGRREDMVSVLEANRAQLILSLLGRGTAMKEHLLLYGLEATEKAVICTVAGGEQTRQIIKSAKRRLFIDIPGNGILMAVPVKSVGGGRTLAYLTDNTVPDGGVPELKFDYELIVVVLNEGRTDMVMNAARRAGAGGGTVLHAKGTGAKRGDKFFGVSLADEKEMIFIVSKSEEKAAIMRAIADDTGPGTPAGAICFSLPISAVAGLRVLED